MKKGRALFIPHGGGPLPLLGDPGHAKLTRFLQQIGRDLPRPEAIIVISAHWEQPLVSVTASAAPELIYDYGGFAPESYQIQYPAPGNPALAQTITDRLQAQSIACRLDTQRGFDHGLFVPLKLMYPQADIPCLQISLLHSLDAQQHLQLGHALQPLLEENILLLGSGLSFHNLRAFFTPLDEIQQRQNHAFEDWLIETCCTEKLSGTQREQRLIDWQKAPHARWCHPREEHLLPLHVCAGAAQERGQLVFSDTINGIRCSAFLW